MGKAPRVTVLLPVYNAQEHLKEALDSILNQDYADFECLIIDDGSTDNSAQILTSYSDPRIRIVTQEENSGLIAVLNKGLSLAKGEYIARMDADDIAYPSRLSTQLQFMEDHPEVGICGTAFRCIGDREAVIRHPEDSKSIKIGLLFGSVLGHPTVMIRKSVLDEHKLSYDSESLYAEDYDLWTRAIQVTDCHNLKEVLLDYRFHKESVSQKNLERQRATAWEIQVCYIEKVGLEPVGEEKACHNMFCYSDRYSYSLGGLKDLCLWFNRIIEANKYSRFFDADQLSHYLAEQFFFACFYSSRLGLDVWRLVEESPLTVYYKPSFKLKWECYFRCALTIKK